MTAHQHRRLPSFAAVAILASVLLCTSAVLAQGKVTKRPLADFLSTQGTFCIDDGGGGCFLFVPPDPNFLGWSTDFDLSPLLFAGLDYAGLADAYPSGSVPTFAGSVSERLLADGRAEVTVSLHTRGANVWVIELDLSGDILAQIAGSAPTLFGHRPSDVLAGAGQALADSFLHVVMVLPGPGEPLPDLVELANFGIVGVELKSLRLRMQASGPLTAAYGVAEGTPGRATIIQTGLFAHPQPGIELGGDPFPVESINLKVVGH